MLGHEDRGRGRDGRRRPKRRTRRSADETTKVDEREKVIVRSNGTVTYVGKDMAYQFWKSGLLGRDFSYRKFARRIDGGDVWATTSSCGRRPSRHIRRSVPRRRPTT